MPEEVTHTLKIKFKRAIIRIQNLSSRPSNKYLLDLYALFKQANEGDCIGRGNGSLRQRAKFKAWNSLIGMSKFDAMKNYCNLVDHLIILD